jgi:molybdopterin molybdotransferase
MAADCAPDAAPLLAPDEALRIVLGVVRDEARAPGSEKVWLGDAAGRVLFEDVCARTTVPPFDCSAMDGYAVRAADTQAAPVCLRVVGESRAGAPSAGAVGEGEAVRVFTGAGLPPGADAVVMQEVCREPAGDEARVEVGERARPGQHVRRAGEDLRAGALVLAAGAMLGAAEIGVLAAAGRASVRVARRPRVAILSSGDELVDVDGDLGPPHIVSSNDHALAAAVLEAGGVPTRLGIAGDTHEALDMSLEDALGADVIVTTGGVSVGAHDLVKPALARLGFEPRFWQVAIKPGKPITFGLTRGIPTFGLPGNPVSALVTFELFVRPALRAMQGHRAIGRTWLHASLGGERPVRGNPHRVEYLRAVVTRPAGERAGDLVATPTAAQGSGQLSGMTGTNGFIVLAAGAEPVAPGQPVDVMLHGDVLPREG